jgi:hypothetical protein
MRPVGAAVMLSGLKSVRGQDDCIESADVLRDSSPPRRRSARLPRRRPMIICQRCGWLIPVDCTCRTDELSQARLKGVVEDRHQESVDLAYRSGWPTEHAPGDSEPECGAAG